VYVVPATGGVPRQLAASLANVAFPVWAPTGSHVLVLGRKSPRDGPYTWWVTPLESDTAKQVEGPGPNLYPELWTADGVIYGRNQNGGVVNLWQYPLSEGTLKRTDEQKQLTSGVGRQTQASVSAARDLAFAAVSVENDVWMVPFDAGSGKSSGEPRPVTHDDSSKRWLQASGDGRLLAYESDRSGKPEVWIRDFHSGKEMMAASGTEPRLSRDGKQIVYLASDGTNRANYVVNLGDNVPRKVGVSDTVWALSSDGLKLLAHAGDSTALRSVDVATGHSTLIVPSGLFSIVYQASFSPDDRWIAFVVKTAPELSQVFVVPYQDGVTPERRAWIEITDGRSWEAGPQWSPNGDTLYFPSERDGFRCLWGQRLESATRRPAGAPFVVRHFHEAQRPSMTGFTLSGEKVLQFAVAVDKIVYNLTQVTGNIWMIRRDGK
jgi:Tol biopolymer transport system component